MMEFKRKEFIFKLDGNAYNVKHPTVKQVQEFQKDTEGKKESDSLGATIQFLSGLGLPEEIAYGMEPEHLKIVVDNISGTGSVKK